MKISVITATWNSGKTVQDTIDSVLRQRESCHGLGVEVEHVIKDGGSKDDTVDIIKRNESCYHGDLLWISEADGGIYDAMNKGIEMATGDIVGILNSDDFYTSDDVLATVAVEFDADPELDAVYGDIHYVHGDDLSRCVRYYSSAVFRPWLMRFGFMPAHPSLYVRKSVYDRFKPYFNTSYQVAADFENLLRMIYLGRIRAKYIKKDFVTMRTGGASSSGVESHKKINRDHLRALRENGVYSNIFFLGLRYIYKIGELIAGKLRR